MNHINNKQGTVLRTPETWERYKNEPKRYGDVCFMCSKKTKIVKDFKYWLIIENDYPYDAVATIHHLLIPKGHVTHVNGEVLDECIGEIADYIEQNYDFAGKNTKSNQTQPQHYHKHLLKWKRL